ncbi:hypothetical protein F4777DRAFT_549579 [Nemania sp. FL0916]|nr:hypothetical protein F4777DRAFT_549579 [Nemania sp. FL0916]
MMLRELYSKLDPPRRGGCSADIVLVHGLKGHWTGTWEAPDGTVWPRDLLPKHLRNANIGLRVLSFEYGGSISGTSSKAGITDCAQTLLQYLIDERDDERRPVVFVGHSLGGVIVKRAIRIAYDDPAFESIKNATLGVVFFATPHGGDRKHFSLFLNDALDCVRPTMPVWPERIVRPSRSMKEEIQKDPGLFPLISRDFLFISSKLSFYNFREERIMKLLRRVVVDKTQGTLDHKLVIDNMISGDHISLCKFGQDESGFSSIWQGMEAMVLGSSSQNKANKRLEALESLCSSELCQSMMARKPMNDTGKWIFERTEFADWRNHDAKTQRLWISGPPSCGKSYLAKNIVDELKTNNQLVVCAFLGASDAMSIDLWHELSGFLQQAMGIIPRLPDNKSNLEGTEINDYLSQALHRIPIRRNSWSYPTESNILGLLASTVRQVLDMEPEPLDSMLMPKWDDVKLHGGWTLSDLRDLWFKVMAKVLGKRASPIFVVIDGFDEMDRGCQEEFWKVLQTLSDKAPRESQNMKLLLLSNKYADLDSAAGKNQFIRYTITDKDTVADITKTIDHALKSVNKLYPFLDKQTGKKMMSEAVSKAANGIYLQADLVLGSLKHTPYKEHELDEFLKNPPRRTVELYDHLFGRIWKDAQMRRPIKQVLSWAIFQREGLSAAELGIALALGVLRERNNGESIDHDKLRDNLNQNTNLWVGRYCGHLVKFKNNRYELVHPSLRKYLLTDPDQLDGEYDDHHKLLYHADFYLDEAEGHAELGRLCATYLAMPIFAQSVRSMSTSWSAWHAALKQRMKEHEFLRYAALHWLDHLRLAGDLSPPGRKIREEKLDRERRQLLENQLLGNAESWAEVRCYFHDWHQNKDDSLRLCLVDAIIKGKSSPPGVTRWADTQAEAIEKELPALTKQRRPPPPPKAATTLPVATTSVTAETPVITETPVRTETPVVAATPPVRARRDPWLVRRARTVSNFLGQS